MSYIVRQSVPESPIFHSNEAAQECITPKSEPSAGPPGGSHRSGVRSGDSTQVLQQSRRDRTNSITGGKIMNRCDRNSQKS